MSATSATLGINKATLHLVSSVVKTGLLLATLIILWTKHTKSPYNEAFKLSYASHLAHSKPSAPGTDGTTTNVIDYLGASCDGYDTNPATKLNTRECNIIRPFTTDFCFSQNDVVTTEWQSTDFNFYKTATDILSYSAKSYAAKMDDSSKQISYSIDSAHVTSDEVQNLLQPVCQYEHIPPNALTYKSAASDIGIVSFNNRSILLDGLFLIFFLTTLSVFETIKKGKQQEDFKLGGWNSDTILKFATLILGFLAFTFVTAYLRGVAFMSEKDVLDGEDSSHFGESVIGYLGFYVFILMFWDPDSEDSEFFSSSSSTAKSESDETSLLGGDQSGNPEKMQIQISGKQKPKFSLKGIVQPVPDTAQTYRYAAPTPTFGIFDDAQDKIKYDSDDVMYVIFIPMLLLFVCSVGVNFVNDARLQVVFILALMSTLVQMFLHRTLRVFHVYTAVFKEDKTGHGIGSKTFAVTILLVILLANVLVYINSIFEVAAIIKSNTTPADGQPDQVTTLSSMIYWTVSILFVLRTLQIGLFGLRQMSERVEGYKGMWKIGYYTQFYHVLMAVFKLVVYALVFTQVLMLIFSRGERHWIGESASANVKNLIGNYIVFGHGY